jgi:ASCH domain
MGRVRGRQAPKIRWTPELTALRALSVRQPWAWLIVNGYKDIENRTWQTRHRGPLLIHAGVSKSDLKEELLASIEQRYGVRLPRSFEHGGVIGLVDVTDCKKRTQSPWHQRGSIG